MVATEPTTSARSDAPTEANKAIVRRLIEAINTRDLSALDEVIAPEFIHRNPADPTLPRGPEAFRQLMAAWYPAFPEGRETVEDQIAEGDKVVTRWSFCGRHDGTLFGVEPTGKTVTFSGIFIDRLKGGKIVEHWDEADILGLMEQLTPSDSRV
jgi:steroid delta-isomerase-like uncharacterized protein